MSMSKANRPKFHHPLPQENSGTAPDRGRYKCKRCPGIGGRPPKVHHRDSGIADGLIQEHSNNKPMILICSKTREMVVVRTRGSSKAAEPPIAGGNRSSTMNILSVTINERLSVSDHVNNSLGSCSYIIYVRTQNFIRSRGMP